MAVWYDLIINFRDYMRARSPLPAKIIEAGALDPDDLDLAANNDGDSGAIFLIRDREPDEKLYHGGEGVVVFFIENWTRSDDPDPAEGYRLLSEQEDRCQAALVEWANQNGPIVPGVDVIQIQVEETIGDADSRRPTLGSRKTVRVEWSKRTI